jgi:hypothetical protein
MEKDPERRYCSAAHLADDLRRHLVHQPVTARGDSPGYRMARFMRRNSLPVVLAGAAAIAGFAMYEAYTGRKRARQAAVADRALKRELAAAYRLVGDLQARTPSAHAYAEMVQITKRRWEADSSDASTLRDFGAAQLGLGLVIPEERITEKRAALERARDWLTEAVGQNSTDLELSRQLDTASAALAAQAQGNTKQ